MQSKSITVSSLLFLSYVINVFADFTITPNVNPGGNTIISSHTDSGILFEDLGNGGQGIRLRGWGDGLHWDYGNYIKISSEDADLALEQIEVSYLNVNNLDENSDVADFWFRFSGYDSSGTVTYQETHYADRIISEEHTEYFSFDGEEEEYSYTSYDVDWGDQIKTYTFTDEFAGSSYIQVEISYQTLIVIKDVNLMPDSDRDGLNDFAEVNTYSTDPNDADSDDDLLPDLDEISTFKTNPNLADSDSDGLNDFLEIGTYSTDPLQSDSDSDGISDGDEVNTYSTNPLLEDTSGDGFTDGFLVSEGFTPTTDYNALRTEAINQMLDLRIGSTMIEVSGGKADITMTLEETSDLSDWSSATTSEKTIEVDSPAGTRFYRFKMTE